MFTRLFFHSPRRLSAAPVSLCVLAVLLFGGIVPNPAQAAIYISGRVGLTGDRSPVADATIALYPKGVAVGGVALSGDVQPVATTQSLGNGSFLIVAPSKGSYHLVVRKEDYFTSDWPVEVTAKGVTALQLTITRPPTIRLHLVRSNGKPVGGGDVTVWTVALPTRGDSSTLKWDTRAVPSTGIVEVTAPSVSPAVVGRIGIGVRSVQAGCATVWVDGVPSAPLTMRLEPGITIRGKVFDADGNPAPAVRVAVESMSRSLTSRLVQGWAMGTTDERGLYEIRSLLPGRYTVQVRLPGGGTCFRLVNLTAAAPPVDMKYNERLERAMRLGAMAMAFRTVSGQVTLSLPSELLQPAPGVPPLVVAGRLLSKETHAPIAGAIVSLSGLVYRQMVDVAQSGPDGSYSLQTPVPGRYILVAQDAKHSSITQRMILPLESSTTTDIEMSARQVATVHLLGIGGQTLPPGQVEWVVTVSSLVTQDALSDVSLLPANGIVDVWEPTSPRTRVSASQNTTHVRLTFRDPDVGCAVVELDKWPEAPLTVQLHKGATLTGAVVDAGGKPAGDAKLSVFPVAVLKAGRLRPIAGTSLRILADVNGKFTVPNLPDGPYTLRGNIPGVGVIIRQFTIAGADKKIDLAPEKLPVAAVATGVAAVPAAGNHP
ncbi:MAG: carboxypeptidase-like regulatory domain-containing protein [Armatimonadota bacterium]|nr:carboxypeptidase-like regulatory domain-containing protein [Armatimonadota bacterium]